jgi:hypothetical protein
MPSQKCMMGSHFYVRVRRCLQAPTGPHAHNVHSLQIVSNNVAGDDQSVQPVNVTLVPLCSVCLHRRDWNVDQEASKLQQCQL